MTASAIKSMKLYADVERIYRDLVAAGVPGEGPIDIATLSQYDQYHYFGTDAVDEAIKTLGLEADDTVLDVGSGLGGPARYIAHRASCHVTAVELQENLNDVATSLTRRCGLESQVDHVCADMLTWDAPEQHFDAMVSWLAIYHIADHETLFRRCHNAIRPGGRMYIEDLFGLGAFSTRQRELLERQLFGMNLPSRTAYINELSIAGFSDIRFSDVTESWSHFCLTRIDRFRADRARHVSVHGEEVVAGLDAFYAAVAELFRSGNLGGARITAVRR